MSLRERKEVSAFQLWLEGHFARYYPNPSRHIEGTMGTMNKVIQSGWLSEEEWDVEACIVAEDDGAYFVEDLTESEALSSNIATKEHEEEEEWDAEAGFAMEVRDSDTCTIFIVFEYDDDEDWETLNDKGGRY